MLVTAPLVLLPGVRVSWFSVCGVASAGLILASVVVLMVSTALEGEPPSTGFSENIVVPSSDSMYLAVGLAGFSWVGFGSIPLVYGDLRFNTEFPDALRYSNGLTATVYALVAVGGYSVFGEQTDVLLLWTGTEAHRSKTELRAYDAAVVLGNTVLSVTALVPFLQALASLPPRWVLPLWALRVGSLLAVASLARLTAFVHASVNVFALTGSLTLVTAVTFPFALSACVLWQERRAVDAPALRKAAADLAVVVVTSALAVRAAFAAVACGDIQPPDVVNITSTFIQLAINETSRDA